MYLIGRHTTTFHEIYQKTGRNLSEMDIFYFPLPSTALRTVQPGEAPNIFIDFLIYKI